MWRHRPPARFDLTMDHETFALANYQFVLYGMGFETRLADRARYSQGARAREEFARVQAAARHAVAALPAHRRVTPTRESGRIQVFRTTRPASAAGVDAMKGYI